MPTYSEIQKFVQRRHGFVPKTAWIAHVKALRGISTRRAPNRAGRGRRVVPCPPRSVKQSRRRFGISV